MIYEFPSFDEPIRQGDIFKSIPMVVADPSELLVINEQPNGSSLHNWTEISDTEEVRIIARIEAIYGIVVTQDCDTTRDKYIAFFKIDELKNIYKEIPNPTSSPQKQMEGWVNLITRKARNEQKWFYLPPDSRIGFIERMAATFQIVVPVRTAFLEKNRAALRIGRLNSEADEHFREHVAQYFRRYPYDEWYPLNKDEFAHYKSLPSREDTTPREWQK